MKKLSDLLRMYKRRRFMKAMEPIWRKLSGVTEDELEKDFRNWRKARRDNEKL